MMTREKLEALRTATDKVLQKRTELEEAEAELQEAIDAVDEELPDRVEALPPVRKVASKEKETTTNEDRVEMLFTNAIHKSRPMTPKQVSSELEDMAPQLAKSVLDVLVERGTLRRLRANQYLLNK